MEVRMKDGAGKKEDRRAAYVIQIDVEAASDGVSRERDSGGGEHC